MLETQRFLFRIWTCCFQTLSFCSCSDYRPSDFCRLSSRRKDFRLLSIILKAACTGFNGTGIFLLDILCFLQFLQFYRLFFQFLIVYLV